MTFLRERKITSDFINAMSKIYHNINLDNRVLILYLYENVIPYI